MYCIFLIFAALTNIYHDKKKSNSNFPALFQESKQPSDEGLRKPETYRDVGVSDKKNRTILIYHDMKNFTF